MAESFCDCETWKYYVINYEEVFSWYPNVNKWYMLWVHLSKSEDGCTQVNRYAIPISHCPSCGGKLKKPLRTDEENGS